MSSVAFSRFLRYFVVVAKLGSIRKSAEALNISASAIDRQILRAEADLNFPLFERLPTGLRLTTAGELVLSLAQRWTRDYDQLLSLVEDLRGLRRGHVRLAVIEALTLGFLPKLLSAVRRETPGVTFDIQVLDNPGVMSAVATGDVDFGIALNPLTTRDFAVRAHIDVSLGFIAHPDHPLAHRSSAKFNEAAAFPLIAPAAPLALCDPYNALQAASGLTPRVVASVDNIQMIKSLVMSGMGVGLLAWTDVVDEVQRGDVHFAPLTDSVLRPMALGLGVHPSRQLSTPARLMIARVETELMALVGAVGRPT